MSAIQPLKALKKAFTTAPVPYPLDSGHSNNSRNQCFRLRTRCCPFNYNIKWRTASHCVPLLDLFRSGTQTMMSMTKSSSRFLKLSNDGDITWKALTSDRRGHRSLELAILLKRPKSSHVSKHDGPNTFPPSTSSFIFGLENFSTKPDALT